MPEDKGNNEEVETFRCGDKLYRKVNAVMLWPLTRFDGPMTGIALFDCKYYYAVCWQSALSRKKRNFWLYPLAKEEVEREEHYQNLVWHYYGRSVYDLRGKLRGNTPAHVMSWSEWIWNQLKRFGNAQAKPSYNLLDKWAGIINRDDYTKREAIGFFRIDE